MVLTVQSLPENIYLLKVTNKSTRKRCEMCSKLTLKTPERRQWTYFTPFCSGFIVYFEQVNVSWVITWYSSRKQISTIPKTEWKWRAKLVDHKTLFLLFWFGASYTVRAFKNYRADYLCGICVIWFF